MQTKFVLLYASVTFTKEHRKEYKKYRQYYMEQYKVKEKYNKDIKCRKYKSFSAYRFKSLWPITRAVWALLHVSTMWIFGSSNMKKFVVIFDWHGYL